MGRGEYLGIMDILQMWVSINRFLDFIESVQYLIQPSTLFSEYYN